MIQPPCKAGPLQQVAQVGVQAGLEYLQRKRIHSLSEQPVPVLLHPYSEEALMHIYVELPMLPFVAISICPIATHH